LGARHPRSTDSAARANKSITIDTTDERDEAGAPVNLSNARLAQFARRRHVAAVAIAVGMGVCWIAHLEYAQYWLQLGARRFDYLEVEGLSFLLSVPLKVSVPAVLGPLLVLSGAWLFLRVAFEQRREERATREPRLFD
jgi:hypothetical protein